VNIVHGSDLFSEWLEAIKQPEEVQAGWPTLVWPGFNHHFGGARNELVVLTGETGRGKTTWALNWLKDQVEQGRPCLLLSLENGPNDAIAALSHMVTGKKLWLVTDDEKSNFGKKLAEWPLYVVNHEGPLRQQLISNAIDLACLRYGVKFVLIDHLEFILKEHEGQRSENYVIDDCCRWLSGRAGTLKTTILLICHPAKRAFSARGQELDLDDLKGTSGIKQTAASVLVHYRPREDADETWIRLAKMRCRYTSQYTGGRIQFGFNPARQQYVEKDGTLDWGKGD
jgi:replicative DNA helicase